jgi:hypothetical protein
MFFFETRLEKRNSIQEQKGNARCGTFVYTATVAHVQFHGLFKPRYGKTCAKRADSTALYVKSSLVVRHVEQGAGPTFSFEQTQRLTPSNVNLCDNDYRS